MILLLFKVKQCIYVKLLYLLHITRRLVWISTYVSHDRKEDEEFSLCFQDVGIVFLFTTCEYVPLYIATHINVNLC